jgi:hypothetical protein
LLRPEPRAELEPEDREKKLQREVEELKKQLALRTSAPVNQATINPAPVIPAVTQGRPINQAPGNQRPTPAIPKNVPALTTAAATPATQPAKLAYLVNRSDPGNVRLQADANAIADELRNITINSPGSRDGFDRGRDSHSGHYRGRGRGRESRGGRGRGRGNRGREGRGDRG